MEIPPEKVKAAFPFPSFRPRQEGCITAAIESLFGQQKGAFIIDAPVGYGKSAVLMAIANYAHAEFGSTSYYITTQKVLQDQLTRDFGDCLPQVKGRANYRCLENPNISCDRGSCISDAFKSVKSSIEDAESSLGEPGRAKGIRCKYHENRECLYLKARDKATGNFVCGSNFAYFSLARRILGKRDILIVDEAHSLPELAVRDLETTIREGYDDRYNGLTFDIPSAIDFDGYVSWMKDAVIPAISSEAKSIDKELESLADVLETDTTVFDSTGTLLRKYNNLMALLKKATAMVDHRARHGDEWAWSRGEGSITFTPLSPARFLKDSLWSRAGKVVLASGTIYPEYYIKETGMTELAFDRSCVYSVPSSFDPVKSPIYCVNAGKMTYTEKKTSFPRVMEEIAAIVSRRLDRRGIIHSRSYENARYIKDGLWRYKDTIVVQDRDDREGSIERWLRDKRKSSVFISTAMTDGLDLRGDLCRYQIYVQVAYPPLTDARAKRRLELGNELWYNYQAIEDVEQGSGRATRSEDDWSEMFVLDSTFSRLKTQYYKYLKRWFTARLKTVPSASAISPPPIRPVMEKESEPRHS